MQQEWRWWSEESSSVLKTLLLTITLYNSSGASEKRKYISFQIHGCKLFMTWINTRTSPWHIQVNRMHLVLFPPPSSLQPSCNCRCSPHTHGPNTHKYELRAQNTHILLFARYTFPNTKYIRNTCLVPVEMQLQTFPQWLDLPHVRLSNVSALSQLLRFLRLFKTNSLQLPSLVGEHNFAT